MLNDRTMTRVAMLVALAALPSLASSQVSQSSQVKAPDWFGQEVTQITIDGSPEQLKAFHEELQKTFVKSGLEDKTIIASPVGKKKKLVYSYLTENEKKSGESTVSAFYSALKGSSEKTMATKKPPVMQTSIFASFSCRLRTCGGQQGWVGRPIPPCDC